MSQIQFTRLRGYDINGNARYVCHYLNLLTKQEKFSSLWDSEGRRLHPTPYEIAVQRANKIGGRKYNTKAYGGGIVFQVSSLQELEHYILHLVSKAEKEQED